MQMHSACWTLAAPPVSVRKVWRVMDSCVWVSIYVTINVFWDEITYPEESLWDYIWYRDTFIALTVAGASTETGAEFSF